MNKNLNQLFKNIYQIAQLKIAIHFPNSALIVSLWSSSPWASCAAWCQRRVPPRRIWTGPWTCWQAWATRDPRPVRDRSFHVHVTLLATKPRVFFLLHAIVASLAIGLPPNIPIQQYPLNCSSWGTPPVRVEHWVERLPFRHTRERSHPGLSPARGHLLHAYPPISHTKNNKA